MFNYASKFIALALGITLISSCSVNNDKVENMQPKQKSITIDKMLDNFFMDLTPDELSKYDEFFRIPIKNEVYDYSERLDIDPNLVFVIIKQESRFDPNAKSGKNALGYMQVTGIAHDDMYQFMWDPDFEKFRTNDSRTNAISGILAEVLNDSVVIDLYKQKASLISESRRINEPDKKKLAKIFDGIRNELNTIEGQANKRIRTLFHENKIIGENVNNDYLLPIGMCLHARHVSKHGYDNIDKILADYNQGNGRTREMGDKVTDYDETIGYLKHIKENHPTFTNIHNTLQQFLDKGLSLSDIEGQYTRFFYRVENKNFSIARDIDTELGPIKCTLYKVKEGDSVDYIARKFAQYPVRKLFAEVNPGVKTLQPGQFVYVPIHKDIGRG